MQKHVHPGINYRMRIEPLGDSALLVRVVEEFEADKSLDAVLRAAQQLELARIPGIIELAPAYTTIGIFFDPARIGAVDEFRTRIEQACEGGSRWMRSPWAASLEVPVCYEAEFAPDLDEVARHTALSPEEIVRRHAGANYRVSCVEIGRAHV